jgi:hypothetical protein
VVPLIVLVRADELATQLLGVDERRDVRDCCVVVIDECHFVVLECLRSISLTFTNPFSIRLADRKNKRTDFIRDANAVSSCSSRIRREDGTHEVRHILLQRDVADRPTRRKHLRLADACAWLRVNVAEELDSVAQIWASVDCLERLVNLFPVNECHDLCDVVGNGCHFDSLYLRGLLIRFHQSHIKYHVAMLSIAEHENLRVGR